MTVRCCSILAATSFYDFLKSLLICLVFVFVTDHLDAMCGNCDLLWVFNDLPNNNYNDLFKNINGKFHYSL